MNGPTGSPGANAEKLQAVLELAKEEFLRHLDWRLDGRRRLLGRIVR